ncbi:MAG: SRPBCC family protein [Proteobacteria bacterium]|nr:SRPBCC family protein [Pseudomonadota bacterium]
MTRTTITRRIQAPPDLVFETVAKIENFANAVPGIVRTEFLSEVHEGVGTRFRETRVFKGKEASTDLEVTEFVPNERVRMVAESHGTVWDTVFSVALRDDHTELEMVMDAKAQRLLPKLINPMMRAMIQKTIEEDMDAVKSYCEESWEDQQDTQPTELPGG